MKTKKLYSGDVCRRLLKIYMWSYNLVRKGPHPYLLSFVQTNIHCSSMDYSTRSEWTTDKSSACVCLFRNFIKNTSLTREEHFGVRPPGVLWISSDGRMRGET